MRKKRESDFKTLLNRYDSAIEEIHKLKSELAREKEINQNYWNTIVWLRSTVNSQVDLGIESCPFCGSKHVGLEGSTCDAKWFIICDCGATGPECNSEHEAIQAWNKAARNKS